MKTAALDIETTGTAPDDRLTVVGIDIPMGSCLFLNTGGREYADATTDRLHSEFERVVNVTAHDSERDALEAFRAFVGERFSQTERADSTDEFKYAAYNGETWNGGFDLPFLRTRYRDHDIAWPLQGPYIDVMAVVGDRFNVSGKSLETTYGELVGDGLNERDPFESSGEAVKRWEDGAFEALLRHNLVDIRRTRTLVRVAERYCSSSHFSMRSLEPIDPET
jgi:uncharacterized protein YprB with RNaseH-like and TPR domain